MRVMRPLGGTTAGNRVVHFTDGDAMFEALWAAIDSAQQRVWLETYIFRSDRVGQRTLDGLVAAAQRGCDVMVIYDYIGSIKLFNSFFDPLRAAGGRVYVFNPVWPWRKVGPFKLRDHRKLIVVDERIGFCGGMNIGEEYAGARYGTNVFRDSNLMIEGPAVQDIARVMLDSVEGIETWHWRPRFGRTAARIAAASDPAGAVVQVLASDSHRGRCAIQRALRIAIRESTRRCYITTPYFLPRGPIHRAILYAAKRGVDVRLVTSAIDVPPVRVAARRFYRILLKHGVKIYEMLDRPLHAKTVVIDDEYVTVGSFNLDICSDRNLEANISALDRDLARDLVERFHKDVAESCEITIRSLDRGGVWANTIAPYLAYRFVRVLG